MLVELCVGAFNQCCDFMLVRLTGATAGDSCLSNMMKENKIHRLGVGNGSIVPTLIMSASTLLVLLQADPRETICLTYLFSVFSSFLSASIPSEIRKHRLSIDKRYPIV